MGQCLAGRGQRVLGGGVRDLVRRGDAAGDRGDVDDVARAPLAHRRQHGLYHPDRPPVVGLEHFPMLGLGRELEGVAPPIPAMLTSTSPRPRVSHVSAIA